jgi:hypothetical protein
MLVTQLLRRRLVGTATRWRVLAASRRGRATLARPGSTSTEIPAYTLLQTRLLLVVVVLMPVVLRARVLAWSIASAFTIPS